MHHTARASRNNPRNVQHSLETSTASDFGVGLDCKGDRDAVGGDEGRRLVREIVGTDRFGGEGAVAEAMTDGGLAGGGATTTGGLRAGIVGGLFRATTGGEEAEAEQVRQALRADGSGTVLRAISCCSQEGALRPRFAYKGV